MAKGDAIPSELSAHGAWHGSLTYSAAELRELVHEAWLRGIRVVPELDMPAHAASWAFSHPNAVVGCPARVAADGEGLEHGVDKPALNPLVDETYEVAADLLAELASIFPDE